MLKNEASSTAAAVAEAAAGGGGELLSHTAKYTEPSAFRTSVTQQAAAFCCSNVQCKTQTP